MGSGDGLIELQVGRPADFGQVEYLRTYDISGTYIDETATVIATVSTARRSLELLYYEAEPDLGDEPSIGCVAVVPEGKMPVAATCGLGRGPYPSKDIWSFTVGGVRSHHDLQIQHSPGADLVVIDTADGRSIRLRPVSDFTYYEWEGMAANRVSIYWPDGSRTERWIGG